MICIGMTDIKRVLFRKLFNINLNLTEQYCYHEWGKLNICRKIPHVKCGFGLLIFPGRNHEKVKAERRMQTEKFIMRKESPYPC